jgi:DNA-binding CsgD family transcriptional regulator
MPRGPTALHGRATECRRIDELLADLRAGAGGSLLFTGEPGIGKSALLTYAAERAGPADVLMVHGAEAERELPFAGLHALLGPVRHLLPNLPEPQCAALAAGLGTGAPPALDDTDPYVVAAGTLSLLTADTAECCLLLLVDDLHLLDQVSQRVVLFVARRAAGARVGVIVTNEAGAGHGLDGHRLLPLDDTAAEAMLCGAGPARPEAEVLRRLVRSCGGLPVALDEIPAMLTVAELRGAAPLPELLPVGPRVVRTVRRRAAGLGEPHWAALLVVAAAGDAGLLAVRAVLAELGLPADALEVAEAAGLVTCHGNQVGFRDPLVGCAAYEQGDLPRRRQAHAALAAVTTGARRARHLGIATLGVNEAVAAELECAAVRPYAALTLAEAAGLLECAAELTGDAGPKARRSTIAAECWQLAGFPERAARIGADIAQHSDDLCVRADVQAMLARADRIRAHPEQVRRMLSREAVRIRLIDPDRAAAMLLGVADAEVLAGDPAGALAAIEQAERLRCGPAGPPAEVLAGRRAAALAAIGRPAEARRVWLGCRPALDGLLGDGALPVGWRGELWLWYPMLLLRLGELAAVAPILDELVFEARRREIGSLLAGLLAVQAELRLRTGAWEDARAEAEEAVRRAVRLGQGAYEAGGRLCLARLAAARGEVAACHDQLARIRELTDGHRLGSLTRAAAVVEGLLELSRGDDEAAYAKLARETGPGGVPGAGDLGEAAVRTGRLAGSAERYRDATRSIEPFEAARAWLLLGESLGAGQDEGAAALRRAGDMFGALGAAPWVDRVQRALDQPRAGPPPTQGDDRDRPPPAWRLAGLTAQELKVAELVGRGATNREAAKTLFLSPKTVEFHLRSIYRKLRLRSRAELAHLLGRDR